MRDQTALDDIDRRILSRLQGDFPICDRPFERAANELGISEECLLMHLESMLDRRILTRFGPMFQIERMGGAFVLAAMRVPESEWANVVNLVNAMPEVAHNYRREHDFNMWFVLATETPEGIRQAIDRIECATGLAVLAFPKEREYFVELKLVPRRPA